MNLSSPAIHDAKALQVFNTCNAKIENDAKLRKSQGGKPP
jgi:hypothetical protein